MQKLICKLLGFLLLTYAVPLQADQIWQVKHIDHDFYLINQAKQYKIEFDVGTPRFERVEQLNKRFKAVIYFSGDVGTSTIISVHRCLLFDGDKYIANLPYSYINKGNNENLGPTWTISEDKIEIIDSEMGDTWVFE